ncbi:E3 ubiquitin-protein ligase RNF14-like [Acanthochromis polyacanthus]|uniref:E3 ubiquitin-protein ligase RNF14-like n=1 Tax=Acanthochromis polyacanthus TaxID=80966 RepID=UPI0022342522|nr:E3 ubiquitin-protein ligase RNF14-like [Acanthochromis polyacanthus]
MNTDLEEQEDELLALQSIFDSEEFVRDESKSAGEIRVSVELPADFNVVLKEGDSLRQYEISFLPPLLLTFDLPQDYPSSSPPSFTLTCSWLTHPQLHALGVQLTDLYLATGGAVVLFSWVQFLREDALKFLDIHSLLELPSDEHNTQLCDQDKDNAALSEPNNNEHTPASEPTDEQHCDVSDPCEPHLPGSSWQVQENPSASDGSSTESQGALALDSHQQTLSSETVVQNQITQTSDVMEAQTTFQNSEFQADHHNDLSSAAGPLDPNEEGAASLPVHPRDSSPNKHQTSDLSITPSQALMSQILIYNASQKQKLFTTTLFDCGVCFMSWLGSECVQLFQCGHIFCKACLGEFCKVQIKEGNVRGVTCPQADCGGTPTPAQVRSLVGEELFSRYDRLLLQSTLDHMADVTYCPRNSCGSAVIVDKSSTAAMCSVCSFAFCVKCRKTYHGAQDCHTMKTEKYDKIPKRGFACLPKSKEGLKAVWDDYSTGNRERRRLLEGRYGRDIMQGTLTMWLSDDWITDNCKHCPHCFCKIQKISGCNVMTCTQCHRQFCWACLTRLEKYSYDHFQNSNCVQHPPDFGYRT